MKKDWSAIECYRWQESPLGPSPAGSTYGAFRIKSQKAVVIIIASDGEETGWEHVSVTMQVSPLGKPVNILPPWNLMCEIKAMFWDANECVVQFHPPESEYVNNHAACLHLWKWVGGEFPLPPSILVGIKELGTLSRGA
jgi:hypothetical protein